MTFDKVAYWKKRSKEHLESCFKQIYSTITELEQEADHVNLEKRVINLAIKNLIDSFNSLDQAFQEAKVKKGKENAKNK